MLSRMTQRDREFEPPSQNLADDLIGDDPEPEGGWRRFDEHGNRLPPSGAAKPRKPMTWQEFSEAMPALPDNPTIEQWRETVREAEALLAEVDEKDRKLASCIIGDVLIQSGVFLDFVPSPTDEEHEGRFWSDGSDITIR